MKLVQAGSSRSALLKVRTHLKALFEYAIDIDLIERNPARGRKIVIPKKGIKKSCERFYEIGEIHRLLGASCGRDHLILRLLLVCGFRPAELFALRVLDIEHGQILVDEALKSREKGEDRIGDPKTDGSIAHVAITESLETELRGWMSCLKDQRDSAWIFPARTRSGATRPIRPENYLKRVLKPLAVTAGVEVIDTGKRDKGGNPILTSGLTYQAIRRTCATYFRKDLKSAQAQLRHSSPLTTDRHYRKTISADHRAAVEKLDAEFTDSTTEAQLSPRIEKAS